MFCCIFMAILISMWSVIAISNHVLLVYLGFVVKCGLCASCPLSRVVRYAWDFQSISRQRVIIAVFTAVSRLKLAHPACQVAIFVGSFVSTFLQGCGEKEESLSVSDATTTEGNTTMTVTMTTTVTTTPSSWSRSPSNDGRLRVPLWSEIYHTHSRGTGSSKTSMN